MEEHSLSKLLKLANLLQEEILKYLDSKSTDEQIIEILGKISSWFYSFFSMYERRGFQSQSVSFSDNIYKLYLGNRVKLTTKI